MRARIVKPGYFKDADVAKCQPLARILFLGLSCLADREGRLRDKPAEIKAEALPHDATDVDGLLSELHRGNLITRYEVAGMRLIQVSKNSDTFRKHARPHPDETCEEYPAPPENAREISRDFTAICALPSSSSKSPSSSFPSSPTTDLRSEKRCSEPPKAAASEPPVTTGPTESTTAATDDPPLREDKSPVVLRFPVVGGRRGKGPTEWPLTEAKVAEYRESFPGVDVLSECRKALQWCRDNQPKRKTPGGMPAFLSRWLGKAQDRSGMERSGPAAKPTLKDRLNQASTEFLSRGGSEQ